MQLIKFTVFILLPLFSCKKTTNNFNSLLVGHAGNGLTIENQVYASNSKEAIELAIGIEGSNGVEIDVQMSKDETLWLFHDQDLSTNTNGEGCLLNASDEYLSSITHKTVNKEKLIKLDELDYYNYPNSEFLIDVKPSTSCGTAQLQTMINLLEEFHIQHPNLKLSYISNQKDWVEEMVNKGLPTYQEIENLNLNQLIDGVSGIVMRQQNISKEEIFQLHEGNLGVILFNIRAPKIVREALEKNADILIVDDLRSAIIEKYN